MINETGIRVAVLHLRRYLQIPKGRMEKKPMRSRDRMKRKEQRKERDKNADADRQSEDSGYLAVSVSKLALETCSKREHDKHLLHQMTIRHKRQCNYAT